VIPVVTGQYLYMCVIVQLLMLIRRRAIIDGYLFSSVQFYFETNRQNAVNKQKRMNVSNTLIKIYVCVHKISYQYVCVVLLI